MDNGVHAYAVPAAPLPQRPRHARVGEVADGAVIRLSAPTRVGLKSSMAPPGFSSVNLGDGSWAILPDDTPVAILPDPLALTSSQIS